jgi:alpha-glucosidase
MDYHLGGFRAVTAERFEARNVAPNVMGTRGHMLAMYVCFDNPVPMMADFPVAYEGHAGFDFLKLVPTWWDETRVLAGEIGELLVTARRKGADWYVGGMSAHRARAMVVALAFLPEGQYAATIWRDGPEARSDPNDLLMETLRVTREEHLSIRLEVDGGFVARLELTAE